MGKQKEPIDFCDHCQNTGTVDCLCGGDLCICGAEEVPCPRCDGGELLRDQPDDGNDY